MTQDRRMADLPVLPTTLTRALALDPQHPAFFDDVTLLAESDPGVALRLVALANSGAYGRAKVVVRVREAAIRAGAEAATDVILSTSVAKVFVPRRPWEAALWVHAIRVATVARALAVVCEDERIDPDAAYLCGLLHELGRFVLLHEAPWVLRQFVEDQIPPELRLKAERVMVGIDHQMLGADVAARWGLPQPLLAVLLRYPQRDAEDQVPLAGLVRASDRLDPTEGGMDEPADGVLRARLAEAVPAWVPLDADRLVPIVRVAASEARVRTRALLPHLFGESPLRLAG